VAALDEAAVAATEVGVKEAGEVGVKEAAEVRRRCSPRRRGSAGRAVLEEYERACRGGNEIGGG
jgi:hypothetical protein